jgi:hypothetical protein
MPRLKKQMTLPKGGKKIKVAAPHAADCNGARRGSFQRMLRFSNNLVFGADNGVHMQDDFRCDIQQKVESMMISMVRDACIRRGENNGKRLMAQNVVGAFTTWARIVNPTLIKEYMRIKSISDLYTKQMREKVKPPRHAEIDKHRKQIRKECKSLVVKNINTAKETGKQEVTDWGLYEDEDKKYFEMHCLRSIKAEFAIKN